MRPLYVNGATYSSTSAITIKRWCFFLFKMLCFNLAESNHKLQELFTKLSRGKVNLDKLDTLRATAVLEEPAANMPGEKKTRGRGKKRKQELVFFFVLPLASSISYFACCSGQAPHPCPAVRHCWSQQCLQRQLIPTLRKRMRRCTFLFCSRIDV